MSVTIAEILDKKGSTVWTIAPSSPVYDALKLMADKDIGAVVVTEGEKVVGVFSERDYARKVVLKGRWSKDTPVADIMTASVYHVPPWRTIVECMALMTEKHVRHLPVVDNGKLVGIITIGDVVKAVISQQETAIRELEAYVDEAFKKREGKA
jgi:CBS domain-containing protein